MTFEPKTWKQLTILLEQNKDQQAGEVMNEYNSSSIAEFIESLDPQMRIRVFKALDKDKQLGIFKHLEDEDQYQLLSSQSVEFIYKLVEKMPHDERVDLLKSIREPKRSEILQQVALTEREDILKLFAYKEGTTGSIMTTDYAVVEEQMTVEQAINKLRIVAPDRETIYYAYIIDRERVLKGAVSLRQLIVAKSTDKIADLMSTDIIIANVDDPDHVTAQLLKEADLIAVPVTDNDSRLVGIVTFDDAMQVLEEDTTETMLQKAGISGQSDRDAEREKDLINSNKLLNGSIWYPIRLRMMFLFITLAGGFLVGGLIDFYEEVLQAVIVAAVFIPVLMDMGGNVGTQSSTIFARGLALGHIDTSKMFKHIGREVSIGAIMGLALGTIGGLVALYWQGIPNGIPEIGLAVGLGLAIVVPVATLLGFLIPFILLKFGFDHAPGADPFITTIKDFTGLGLYFFLVATFIGV